MLSEISQSEEDKYNISLTLWNLWNKINKQNWNKFINTDILMVTRWDGGWGVGKVLRSTNCQLQKQSQGCKVQHREYSQ